MNRPEHIVGVNTAQGIRRINEEQAYYDEDPERYERQQRSIREDQEFEVEQKREHYYE